MTLTEIFNEYIVEFQEEGLFDILKEQFSKQTDAELISRKNFVGHFTAAAFLVCRDTKRVLLLEHKFLKKLLQPGGHIEESDANPLDAAYRELKEETGIDPDIIRYRCASPGKLLVPFDIDTHFIPENSKKFEPSHHHHDMRYLFTVEYESLVDIGPSESNGYEWMDWQLFVGQPQFKKVAEKIEKLITNRSAGHFF
jgi:8-oxo-dGTP pyrophosphatase MutT (NUDIX family)